MEAKANVSKRLEYINGELKRAETAGAGLEGKQKKAREEIVKLQQKMQQLQSESK